MLISAVAVASDGKTAPFAIAGFDVPAFVGSR